MAQYYPGQKIGEDEYKSNFITLEDVIRMFTQSQAQPTPIPAAPPSMLSAPVNEPIPFDPMIVPSGAMTPTAPSTTGAPPQDFWTGQGLDKLIQTITQPGAGFESPFPRGPEQTGLQNTAAGIGNGIVNLPQNMWHLYSQNVGQPLANAVTPVLGDMWNWATKPEAAVAAENAPAPSPTAGFTPGLPLVNKITQHESGGNPTAKNPTSSAYGPGQFIKSTWMEFIREAHPELITAGKMKEKELLELRSNPAMADEATGWYAGKAVDLLDELDLPTTDGNIYLHHFLGPGGARALLTADPDAPVSSVLDKAQINANKSILGGTRTVQDVIDWAAANMGDDTIQPYTPGASPPPRPGVTAPDMTAMNNWMTNAAPKGTDPQMLKDAQLAVFLQSLGAGIGSVNAEQVGGGAFFGKVGAGATAGAAQSKELALNAAFNDNKAQQEYAGLMAQFEGDKAKLQADITNANAESSWLDAVDLVNKGNQDALASEERNLAIAGQSKLRNTPKVLNSSAQGVVLQQPDGTVSMMPWDQSDQWKQMEDLGKAFGTDSTMFRQQKYGMMAQSGADMTSWQMEIIRDLVTDGVGASIWGDGYTEALAAAEDQLPGGLAADPEKMLDAQAKAVVGLLLGASQATGNYDWLVQAAAMGHPGAQLLVQSGSLDGE